MNQLEKKQSEVRLSTLLVMDEIFRRSHCFRCLLLSQESFDTFLSLIGLSCSPDSLPRPHDGLPPPAAARKRLRSTAIQILDKWNNCFANGYKILSSACLFLSQRQGISFSSRSVMPPHVAAAQEQADQKRKQQLKQRMQKACQQFDELSQEIESTLKQADEAMQLLIPKQQPEAPPPPQPSPLNLYDNDREVSDRMHNSSSPTPCMQTQDLQEHAVRKDVEIMISITAAGSVIKQTTDNQDIIASIRDHYKLLIRIHLPKLKNLMKSLSQGVEYCEETLKRAIDLKNDALIMISKMSELGILSSESKGSQNVSEKESQDDDSDDDDDFVEVPEKEGLQLVIPQHERYLYGLDEGMQPSSSSRESSSQSGRDGGGEGSSTRCCRAPLASGKLCSRRDLIKCPFHGLIVDRDAIGVPVKEEERIREEREKANRVPEWQDPAFLRDLEAATGIDLTVSRHKRKKKGTKVESEAARNPKERIMQRIFTKESRLRVARDMDAADAANHLQYEDNWSYALNT